MATVQDSGFLKAKGKVQYSAGMLASRKALALVGTLTLGWASYISVTAIDNHAGISALEEKQAQDARQDVELREIRRTLQDMTVLFFQLEREEEGEEVPLLAMPAPELPELETFSAAQMAIEELVSRKGVQR